MQVWMQPLPSQRGKRETLSLSPSSWCCDDAWSRRVGALTIWIMADSSASQLPSTPSHAAEANRAADKRRITTAQRPDIALLGAGIGKGGPLLLAGVGHSGLSQNVLSQMATESLEGFLGSVWPLVGLPWRNNVTLAHDPPPRAPQVQCLRRGGLRFLMLEPRARFARA